MPPLCKGRGTALAVEGLLNRNIYILTNPGEITTYFIIGNPQHTNTVLLKVRCSFCIVFHALIFVMLSPIQFHDQLCFCAVKVCDVFAENLLPQEFNRIATKKVIPQMPFLLWSYSYEDLLRWKREIYCVCSPFYNPSVTASPCHLPLHKGGFSAVQNCYLNSGLSVSLFCHPSPWKSKVCYKH